MMGIFLFSFPSYLYKKHSINALIDVFEKKKPIFFIVKSINRKNLLSLYPTHDLSFLLN